MNHSSLSPLIHTEQRSKMSYSNSVDEKTRFSARDSLGCKFSACRLGYFQDPFIQAVHSALNHTGGKSNQVRRSPIIHRGYYARNEIFTKVMADFFAATAESSRQVLFLGAGFDTTPLIPYQQELPGVRTFEVDFPDIIKSKVDIFRTIPGIVTLLDTYPTDVAPVTTRTTTTIGPHTFISQDLRNAQAVSANLTESGFDPTLPTLVLSECVLVYMGKDATLALATELGQIMQSDALWLTYDMITPNDVYGKNMIRNLQNVGFEIPGLKDFPTLEDQKDRFLLTGWSDSHSCNMRFYYDKLLPQESKERISKLEILDEVEEWNMLMEHYSLTIATKGANLGDILNTIP